jgi:hypothetical protein
MPEPSRSKDDNHKAVALQHALKRVRRNHHLCLPFGMMLCGESVGPKQTDLCQPGRRMLHVGERTMTVH